jgi:hypothetical protein
VLLDPLFPSVRKIRWLQDEKGEEVIEQDDVQPVFAKERVF